METGVERIAKERKRQVEQEGWSVEHDDEHSDGSLAMAAACYASRERLYVERRFAAGITFEDPWPWDGYSDKRPHDGNVLKKPTEEQYLRQLEKAGALIAAEIDRLLRKRARTEKRAG